jgi:hypothetical protein
MKSALYIMLFTASCAWASGISGVVQDTSGHVLPDADVQVQSESTGARWRTRPDDRGQYSVAGLPPGRYKVTARMPGFRTVSKGGVALEANSGAKLDFAMELLGLHEVITVVGGRDEMDPSGGDSLLVTRNSPGATLPANGRDFRASFDLMPGVIITPAGVSDAGQFTSNGQRPNASSFRVDGVSANTGVGGSALPGSFPGASLPAMTSIGTTENLASPETTQSVELRTSGFTPEFGERPGAEAVVTTRAGTNDFHAEFFGHVRDSGWTARDWFANSRAIAFPRPYYNNFGAVFGGPILRNRTFVFASAEQSRLSFSGLQLTAVPSLATRRNAPPAVQSILNSFPVPSGRDLSGGTAEGITALTKLASVESRSVRLDQSLGRFGNLFGRIVDSPSTSDSGYSSAYNGVLHWDSATLGVTAGMPGGAIDDFRLNYSRARLSTHLGNQWNGVFDLAGLSSVNPPPGLIYQLGPDTVFGLSIPGLGQFVGGSTRSPRQDQWEVRNTVAKEWRGHQFRAGVDYIRLMASRDSGGASALGVATSLQDLLDGGPLAVTYSVIPPLSSRIHTISLFAQDTVHPAEGLSVVYGIRWELTPPTPPRLLISSISGLWKGGIWQSAQTGQIDGAAPWPMRYGQVAPRVGVAYRVPGSGLVLRAGMGVFFDAALGAAIDPINGAPFNSWELSSGTTSAGSPMGLSGLPGPSQGGTAPDVLDFLIGSGPPLRLPASYQWRASVERSFESLGTASLAYVGSSGRNLLGNEAYVEPDTGVLTRSFTMTRNSSNYQALQARYTGSLGRNIQGSLGYAWSHSIDNGSEDSAVFLIHPGYRLNEARGSSSFDVRHALTAAVSYRVPRYGWTVSGILRARTGFPIDVMNSEQGLGRGFDNVGRPDLVLGVPIWISDASVAGGRRLNPAAFQTPAAGARGTLGRNAIAGNGLAQFDMSVRREFPIYGRISLEAAISVFNVLNHPAFADPTRFLSSPWFGQSTSMQNLMLGSGTPNTGLPPLFQSGGSRSAEAGFRVIF